MKHVIDRTRARHTYQGGVRQVQDIDNLAEQFWIEDRRSPGRYHNVQLFYGQGVIVALCDCAGSATRICEHIHKAARYDEDYTRLVLTHAWRNVKHTAALARESKRPEGEEFAAFLLMRNLWMLKKLQVWGLDQPVPALAPAQRLAA